MLTNLSKPICDYLRHLGYENPEQNGKAAKTLWLHALAVLYTPSYRRENRDALHRGWPRIPLPGFTGKMQVDEARRIIEESAEMGRNIRDILTGTPPPVCPPCIAVLTNGERPLDIANDRRFALEVDGDWDIPGKWNAVRPRPGRYHNRPYKLGEIKALSTLAKKVGMGSETWDNALGNEMVDIALNQYTYCQGIPARVWEYPIGGRQVLAKWLSYREYKIIHRPLRHDEVMHFIDTARRLTILCMLEATLEQLWEQNETRHG